MIKVNTADHFNNLTDDYKSILLDRIKDRIDINNGTGCWEWMGSKYKAGYGQISYRCGDLKINMKAHRLCYQIHHRDSFCGFLIRHLCNNRKCCNPNHLLHGTHKDNSRDSIECGSHAFYKYKQEGSNNFNSSISDETVIKARRLYKTNKYTHNQISGILGVNERSLARAISGVYYSNLNNIEEPKSRRNSDSIYCGPSLSNHGARCILEDYSLNNLSVVRLSEKYAQSPKNINRILNGVRFSAVHTKFYNDHPNLPMKVKRSTRYYKLNQSTVVQILSKHNEGVRNKDIANMYSISTASVTNICKGNIYKEYYNEYHTNKEC